MSSITESNEGRILEWCREARVALQQETELPALPISRPDWAETVQLHAGKQAIEVVFQSCAFTAGGISSRIEFNVSIYDESEYWPSDGRLFAKAGTVLADHYPSVLVDGTVNQIDTLEESPEALRNLAAVLINAADAMDEAEPDRPMSALTATGAARLAGMMREGGFANIGEMFAAQAGTK